MSATNSHTAKEHESKDSRDAARLDYLAEITNLAVLLEFGANLSAEEMDILNMGSTLVERHEFYRRSNDTPTAFRLAIDEAMRKEKQ